MDRGEAPSLAAARAFVVLLILVLTVPAATSWGAVRHETLTDDRPEPYPFYGGRLAAAEDVVAVATGGASTLGVKPQAVDLFHRGPEGTWTREGRFFDPIPEVSSGFARALAASGSTVVIAGGWDAQWWENARPANPIYVLERDADGAWTLTQILDGGPGDLAFDGVTLAIGASFRHVDLYTRGEDGLWTKEASVMRPLPSNGGGYGTVLALAGDRLVVGEPHAHDGLPPMMHMYVRSAPGVWTHLDTIGPSDEDDWAFGAALALEGRTLVVGAPQALHRTPGLAVDAILPPAVANRASRTGAVIVYEITGNGHLAFQQRIEPPAPVGASSFGAALAIAQGTILIGDPGADLAYVYGPGATLPSEILASDRPADVLLGADVAFAARDAVVGSPAFSVCCLPEADLDEVREGATSDGRALVYDLDGRGELLHLSG